MAGTSEAHEWLEHRLEQHQLAIAAQLKQHQAEVALAIQKGCQTWQQQLSPHLNDVAVAAVATTAAATKIPPPAVLVAQQPACSESKDQPHVSHHAPQSKHLVQKSTSLHALVVDAGTSASKPAGLQTRMKQFLDSYMSGFINVCIVANTVTMFVQLQWLGWLSNNSLNAASPGGWPHAETIFATVEYLFTVIFLIDLVLQISVQRREFFKLAINNFDCLVVVVTTVEVFVLTPLASSIANVSAIRLMRLAKLVRILKAVRTLKAFESLRILISTMAYCIASTFWSLVILLIFQIMAAIFMCQSLHDYIIDESNDKDARLWVNDMYGDGVKSFWTIFELTFSGCWPNYARRIIEEVSPLYSIFFYVYVYIVVFVMTRIVAALFTKETFAQASQDTEMMVRARSQKTAFLKERLSELFDEADTSGDGTIDIEELRMLLDHPKVRLWMKELGVDIADADALFPLLHDSGDGITRTDFVNGITKLRGEARASDLLPVVWNVQRILGHVKALRTTVDLLVAEREARQSMTPTMKLDHL